MLQSNMGYAWSRLVGCAEGEDWWYASCVCHKSLSGDSSPYMCKRCAKYVFHIVPRYKVKAMVDDGTDDAIFVLSDADVNRFVKKCASLVGAAEARNAGFCPCDFEALKDKQLLFIVEKKTSANPNHDGSYKVKGCCNDPGVVDSFLKQVKSRDTAQVDIKDEVLPMEGHPAIHKDEIKELDPVHQSYVTKRKGDSYIFEWEVEITDPVLQATSPLTLPGAIAFVFTKRKKMSIILMDLDTMETYKADIIPSKDKNEDCIADAWIRFAFDNTLRVGDKVCFSLDFDLNSLFAEIVKYVP